MIVESSPVSAKAAFRLAPSSGELRASTPAAMGLQTGIAITVPDSSAGSINSSTRRMIGTDGSGSSPWINAVSPRVGPGFAPFSTCSGKRSSDPSERVVTGNQENSLFVLIRLPPAID